MILIGKKALAFTAFLLVFNILSYTQQKGPVIEFEKLTHNLGKIKEEAGEVSYKYAFVNKGGKPLVINDVKASCGCTTPSWTEKPVMPGEKGYVEVVFDPANRPGNFNKSIVVITNAEKSNQLLRIRGEVIPRKKGVEDKYPKKMNGLRLKSNHLPFRNIKHTSVKTDSLDIINVSDLPVEVSFRRVPEYLELKTIPAKLEPGQKGIIEGKLDATKVDDWGFFVNRVLLSINGSENRNYRLAYSAKIVEDFSQLTPEERENAPKVEFEQKTYDFGTAKQNTEIQHTFRFTNKGRNDLIIRKIRASCGCTTAKPEKSVIPSGESSSFKVTFRTGRRQGPQRLSIYFISNDPDKSTVRLTLKGKVEK